jgi:DNA repair protein RadC
MAGIRKIKDIAKIDRPREKLKAKGPGALSDFELLQALIGSGNMQADVSQIAKDIKKLLQTHGLDVSYEQLEQITGLGSAKITELLAAVDLSKRYLVVSEQPILDSPEKVVEQLADIRDKKQEYFICITLNGANRMIAKRTITIGTLTASLVHPREVFADAITDRAASIIVAHNHPSGSTTPSKADREITLRLQNAGELLGIPVFMHVITTSNNFSNIA